MRSLYNIIENIYKKNGNIKMVRIPLHSLDQFILLKVISNRNCHLHNTPIYMAQYVPLLNINV